ncbi:MAG: hypothetical protein JWO68_2734, partial [Actinomycetia bacterium]|nr:hypothetical protein [Actinomycetes bacterium]
MVLVAVVVGAVTLAPAARAAGAPTEGDVVAYGDAAPLPVAGPEDAVAVAATPLGLGWWA